MNSTALGASKLKDGIIFISEAHEKFYYEKLKEDLKSRALEIGFFDAKIISSRILVYKEQNVADIQLVFDTGKRYQFGAVIADAKTKELMQPSLSLQNFTRLLNVLNSRKS